MTADIPEPALSAMEPPVIGRGERSADRPEIVFLIPGLVLIVLIGVAAYILSQLHESLDALAMAIILGVAARAMVGRSEQLLPGARLGVRLFIPIGIILYGTRLSFKAFSELPSGTILLTLLSMTFFYVIILVINRRLGVSSKTGELVASGSAICGASAIAVLSPAMDAEPEDTSVSLLVVTAIGLLGAMVYPLIKEFFGFSDIVYAVLSGATLHQTGIVRIAVAGMDSEIVSFALAVKSVRILMLLVIALITGLLHSRQYEGQGLLTTLRRVWFLLPFVIVAALVSFVPAANALVQPLKPWATFVFSLALGSIGLMVDIESVLTIGSRPLIAGLFGWLGVVLLFLVTWPLFL